MSLNTNQWDEMLRRRLERAKNKEGPDWRLYNVPDEQDPDGKRTKQVTLPELLTWRNKQARRQMRKKVSAPTKPYVYRLGYNHCIAQFAGSEDYPVLSGSSLNRKKRVCTDKKKQLSCKLVHFFGARSRGKVKDKMMAFYRSIPGDRVFLTLTFIQHVTDRLGCQILNKFLTVVRKECPGFEFLRVAEHQPENPEHTIHFHILMNRKLPVRRYNALWVLQQYNSGLVGKSESGQLIPIDKIKARYEHDMTHPFRKKDPDSIMAVLNPLHVRKAYGINALANYLAKYVTKQEKQDPFGCLTWHCSRKVSKLFTREVVGPSTFSYLLSFKNCRLDRSTGELCNPDLIAKQFYTMVYVHNKSLPLARLQQLEQVNKWIIDDFEPDKLPRLGADVYGKMFSHEKDRYTGAAVRRN